MNNWTSLFIAILVLAGTFFVAGKVQALEIHTDPDNDAYITMDGEVLEGDVEKLQNYIDSHPELSTIYLDSFGGDGYEGQDLGRLIRESGLNTAVWSGDSCESACVEMFLGGNERRIKVTGNQGELGFHASSLSEETEEDDQWFLDVGMIWGLYDALYWSEMLPQEDYVQYINYMIEILSRDDSLEIEYPSVYKLMEMGIVTHVIE